MPFWDRIDAAADDERYGHPATSRTDQTIEQVTCGEKTPPSPQKTWTQTKPEQQLYQKYWQWAKYLDISARWLKYVTFSLERFDGI